MFVASKEILSSELDTKSPEFRVAHVRYYNELIDQRFPMLDKETYRQANKNVLEDDEDSDNSDE